MRKSAYLVLENGTVFEGKSFGYEGEAIGEVVFTTAMTGYIETLTDASYYGQIVTQTFPLVGNYGIIPEDFESDKPYLKAYIVRDWCQHPSNFRCEGLLDTFLKENKIVGLYGIDTRELTKILRDNGVMNAKITTSPEVCDELLSEIKAHKTVGAVNAVTCKETMVYECDEKKYKVALWDFGINKSLIKELTSRGCEVVRVSADAKAESILSLGANGVVIAGGPGDPEENMDAVAEIKKVLDKKIPAFGIGLGHLLMALSQGAKSYKLRYGHRGSSQPSVNVKTGGVYITSQNHGYAIASQTIPANAYESYRNVNDGTCEGIEYTNIPAFSAQFCPKKCEGPFDSSVMFDDFVKLMAKGGRQ